MIFRVLAIAAKHPAVQQWVPLFCLGLLVAQSLWPDAIDPVYRGLQAVGVPVDPDEGRLFAALGALVPFGKQIWSRIRLYFNKTPQGRPPVLETEEHFETFLEEYQRLKLHGMAFDDRRKLALEFALASRKKAA